jgi:hypothetical protein
MRRRQPILVRGDLRRDACTVCEENVLTPSAIVLDATKLLDDKFGVLPHVFRVCCKPCRAFFDGAKKNRKVQQMILERLCCDALGTSVRLGDWVEVFEDKSPGRFVESGDGVVLDVKYDAARGGATIEVALVSGNVRVGPKGLRPIKPRGDENDVPRPRRRPALSGERGLIELQRVQNCQLEAALSTQKRRAVVAERDGVESKRLRGETELRFLDLERCELARSRSTQRLS